MQNASAGFFPFPEHRMPDIAENWGPWREDMTDAHRREAIVVLRTLASIIVGRQHPLYKALHRAAAASEDALGARGVALLEAAIEMERMPTRPRRILLDSYAGNMLVGEPPVRKGRPAGRYDKAERKGAAA
jgi:hypothetical protein